MRIGVVGDTHNQLRNVDTIVRLFRDAGIERLVHTGDITQPKVLERLAALDVPLLGVFGNNDLAERERLSREAARFGMDLADPPRTIEWAGRRILVTHDLEAHELEAHQLVKNRAAERHSEAADALGVAPRLDLVLHGHTHRHQLERRGPTLIFNPGECAGIRPGGNAVGVVELTSLEARLLRF